MTTESSFQLTPRLILGFVILALGLLFTLDNLGFLRFDIYLLLDYWPALFVLWGLYRLSMVRHTGRWMSPLIWIGVGTWLLLYNLALIHVHLFDLWPLLLVLLGATILRRAVFRSPRQATKRTSDAADDSTVSNLVFMCGMSRQNSSKAFRGGDITALMGGCEIDLREAQLSQGEATLDVFALWGGIELRVPREWTVVSNVAVLMGGFDDKTDRSSADPDQRLVLRGIALMGGVEVGN